MIIGISGWQRAGKTLLGVYLAHRLSSILSGFGNLTIHGLNYQYHYMESKLLLKRLFHAFNCADRDTMFYIDEAHRILNHRLWSTWTKEDTFSLAGIFQDDKLSNVIIYTFHPGKPGDELLGVDKLVRACTYIDINIVTDKNYIIRNNSLVYELNDHQTGTKRKHELKNVQEYFSLYDTFQPVV